MNPRPLTLEAKALEVNLNKRLFGTFAEIGAGQEVVRHFFQVGGAAGTIAKAMSAYDMTFSDEIYGRAGRYVSKERLGAMLDHEYTLLIQRLSAKRGHETQFFVFADTVAAQSFRGSSECHGWMGVRLQKAPLDLPSNVIIHVRMLDKANVQQQEALGVVGVNLVHAACFCEDVVGDFVPRLLDGLSNQRIEIDMIEFSGPAFAHVDNRLMSLQLVRAGLSNAAMFAPCGKVLQPSEVLYKKAVLIERGSFRPITRVHMDMLQTAKGMFAGEVVPKDCEIVVLAELTLSNLMSTGEIDMQDFLARVDMISALGLNVLISNYSEFYRLVSYLRRYTKQPVGLAMGVNTLLEMFNERHYQQLEGGLLESLGRTFYHCVKIYAYPMTQEALTSYIKLNDSPHDERDLKSTKLITAESLPVHHPQRLLYHHLLTEGRIVPMVGYNPELLAVPSRDILKKISARDESWAAVVPEPAAHLIRSRGLFGWQGTESRVPTTIIEDATELTSSSTQPDTDEIAGKTPCAELPTRTRPH